MTNISVVKGDITKQAVDAIVNAANSSLLGGGGVDGAIHRAGGPAILEACRAIVARQGSCKTGQAGITTAGNLPAQYVIHTVGPIYNKGNEKETALLGNCYTNSLQLAEDCQLRTIAFSNISTGVYGYPKAAAASVEIVATKAFINQHPNAFDEIVFVCFDQENYLLYQTGFQAD